MIAGVVAAAALLAGAPAAATAPHAPGAVRLDVPVVRQAPERCGPAALAMVLRYYGAAGAALREAEAAYDPALRGALVTDVAAAARRAGYSAAVETPEAAALEALLRADTPPILLYQRGIGPLGPQHYGVLVGWDPARGRYTVHDGGARPRHLRRDDLLRRWRAAGGRAVVVRRPDP